MAGKYEALGEIASLLGQSAFYKALTGYLGEVVNADVQMVMRYGKSAAPVYVVHDGLDQRLMADYLAGLYRIDPVYRHCKGVAHPGVYRLDTLGTSDRQLSQYAMQFLSQAGMVDDLVVLFPAPASSVIALIFERSTPFTLDEAAYVREMYPLFAGLQKAHERVLINLMASGSVESDLAYRVLDKDDRIVFDSAAWQETFSKNPLLLSYVNRVKIHDQQSMALEPGFVLRIQALLDDYATAPGGTLLILERGQAGMSPVNPQEAAEMFTNTVLTPRERDIVRLIFLGFPNAKIAEKLDLSVNTIKNHRKRLYSKLDITTERELLLKFMRGILGETDQVGG